MTTLDTFSKLVFADAQGRAVIVSDAFDFSFVVEKSSKRDPDTVEIVIYNLNAADRQTIGKEAVSVEVLAGKTSPPPRIFKGEVSDVINVRSDDFVDWITTVYAEDTKSPLRTRIVARTYAAGSLVSAALQDLASAADVFLDCSALSERFVSPMSFLGPPRDHLHTICQRFSLRYQMIDGRLVVRGEDDPLNRSVVPVISAKTGLIGVPTIEKDGRQIKTSFRCMLNSDLVPGGLCSIVTQATTGGRKTGGFTSGQLYFLERVKHTKDSDGNDFSTSCVCRAVS